MVSHVTAYSTLHYSNQNDKTEVIRLGIFIQGYKKTSAMQLSSQALFSMEAQVKHNNNTNCLQHLAHRLLSHHPVQILSVCLITEPAVNSPQPCICLGSTVEGSAITPGEMETLEDGKENRI